MVLGLYHLRHEQQSFVLAMIVEGMIRLHHKLNVGMDHLSMGSAGKDQSDEI